MWKPAVHPINPALKCVPDFIVAALPSTENPPPGCPPGFAPAVLPLNPALGCLPTFITSAARSTDGPLGGMAARPASSGPPTR